MRRVALVAPVLAAALLALVVSTPAVARTKQCTPWLSSKFKSEGRYVQLESRALIYRGRISCAAAGRVVRGYDRYDVAAFARWQCRDGTDRMFPIVVTCRRRKDGARIAEKVLKSIDRGPVSPPKPPPTIRNPAISVQESVLTDGLRIRLDPAVFCPAAGPPQPVTLRAAAGSDVAQATLDVAGCDTLSPTEADSTRGGFQITNDNYAGSYGTNSFLIGGFSFGGGTHRMTYSVTQNGRMLASGPFEVLVIPRSKVKEDTDEFVNYCIDQNQTIYSENGVLFCWSAEFVHAYLGWSG